MYCSSCGVAVAQGLSYCNYCGAKLIGAKGDDSGNSSELKPGLLVSAMTALFIFGIVAITMLMGVTKAALDLQVESVLALALLPFLLLLTLEGVFIRLLLRSRHGAEESGNTGQLKGQATKELEAGQARLLPEPVSSVTEHTTRAFDPIYREPTSK